MTVVCYDGETLAADRKSSYRDKEGCRAVKSLDKVKISAKFKNVVFDGESVLAVGRAGRVAITKSMIAVLRKKRDLAPRISELNVIFDGLAEDEGGRGTLMIVTTEHVHVVSVERTRKPYWKRYGRDAKLAIGSGQRLAVVMMAHLGLSAVDAVAVTELGHEGCGGGVVHISRSQALEGEPICIEQHQEREELQTRLLEAVIVSAGKKLKQLKEV